MTFRFWLRSALVLAVAVGIDCPAHGEVASDPKPPTESNDNGDQPSVYVGDSYEARTALRRADRLADGNRRRQAAQAYQQIVEQYPDKLIRLGTHAFVGTAELVGKRIAAWPREGLEIYRLLYADRARDRLERAEASRDISGLLVVAEVYFCTRQGAIAADLAGQLATEAGDFALAEQLYRRLIRRHPDRESLAGDMKAKLALVLVWSGQTDRAGALLDEIRKNYPETTLSWADSRQAAIKIIEQAIADRLDPVAGKQSRAWPLIGGNPRRNAVSVGEILPGAPMWEFGPEQGFNPRRAQPRKRTTRDRSQRLRQAERSLTTEPVTDGENLYFSDGYSVWGLRAEDGSPLWPAYSLADLADRPASTESLGEPPSLHTCTLHNGRLYALLGQSRWLGRGTKNRSTGVMVCLDAATGKAVWMVKLAEIDPSLEEIRLDSAPVCSRDKLLVVGRRRKRFGFEDCYLICLDAAGGRTAWFRHLASASVGAYGLRRATVTFPTVSEATVYVCTNLGAVVAVNAHTGRIRWLRVYHSDRTDEEAGARFARSVAPWRYAPPICWRDKLICTPLDSQHVVIVDRAGGELIDKIPADQLSRFRQVLGVSGDVLYTVGRHLIAWDLVGNRQAWSRSLSAGGGSQLGRGRLTRTHIYLPMVDGLYRFGLNGGRPRGFEWPENAVGGNLLVLPEQVIVVGADRITGYAPKGEAFVRLQRRIKAAPDDPIPLLDLAELAYRVGERPKGIDSLNAAVKTCGGFAKLNDPAIKRRVFRDFVRFGDKAIGDEPPNEALALMMYQQAAQCPPDSAAQVVYRLRLAEALVAMRRYADAVEQYQQIIEDESLRQRTAQPRGSDQTWPAGRWAELRIEELLAGQDRALYDRVEQRARAMLAGGRDQADLNVIQRVVDGFPNSLAAKQALRIKAELLEERGDYRQAVRAYLRLLQRSPKPPEAPDIIRRITAAYLRDNRPAAAGRWMARGARMFPDYRFDHQGNQIGFEEFRSVVAKQQAVAPLLPRFSMPLSKRWSREFPGWVTVLRPIHCELTTTRWDLYVTHCAEKLQAFTAPGGKAKWAAPIECKGRPSLLGMTRRRLVLATRRRLMGLRIDTGKVAWSVQTHAADADGPDVDPEDLRKWTNWTMTDDRVFAVRDDGQAVAVDADTGRVIWQNRLAGRSDRQPAVNEEFFVYEAMDIAKQRMFLHVLDAESGREVRKIKTGDLGRTFWTRMSEQGLLLAATSRQLFAFDPYTGERAWKDDLAFHNLRATLLPGAGSLYLSHNGRTLVRRSMETGLVAAESPSLVGALTSGGIPSLDGDRLFVRTTQAVTALDSYTMAAVWRGTTDRGANLVAHQVGRPFVVAVSRRAVTQGERSSQHFDAYFHDRRQDSGIIHPNGQVDMGDYRNPRGPYFADHTLLIADGQTLYGWTGPGR